MISVRHLRAGLGLALLALLAWAPAAHAQTDVTTSRISGRVEDASKAPLPGVTITAVNLETGLKQVAVSDEKGFYQIVSLPTGRYNIEASLDQFLPAKAENVRLLLGTAPTINFTLHPSAVTETITVTSEAPTVEVTNTAVGTTIQTEQLEKLPVQGRDYRALVLLTPETRFDSERGNIAISGQRGINTNVTVDGVDFNDPFFGGTVGAAEGRAPLALSQESIKEFTVITNGASVEFGRSGGGFVNVITKSGTNELRGSAFYYNQPQSGIANFANGQEPADQKKDEYGASLGGPVQKDKLFYFFSYDKQKQNVTVPINSSVLSPAVFAKYPALASPDNYVQTRDGWVGFGRLDYQLNDSNRVLVRANVVDYTGENGTSSSQAQTASHNGVEGMKSKSYVGTWSSQWGGAWLNDLNLNRVIEDTPREDKGLNLAEVQIPGVSYGEVSFLPIVSTTDRKEASDTVTYVLDRHVMKAGADWNDTGIDQIFKGNWRGVYVFNSQADLLAGRWAQFRQFGGLNGLTADEAGRAQFRQKEQALFLQDQWLMRPNFTITFGVRAEALDNPNAAVLNPNDRNANGSFNLTAHIPDMSMSDQISPRLGFSWAPDTKTAIRFSAGRFWSRTPGILFAQLLTSNGVRATQYIVNSQQSGGAVIGPPTDPLAPGWGANFNPVGVAPVDFAHVAAVPKPGVFAIDPNFKDPHTDRVTLSAEREIMPQWVVELGATYAETKNLERLTDINRVYSGATAPNGLPAYSSTTPDPYYGRITTLVSDARSKYQAFTATLQRRYADHYSLYSSITYSVDKDNDSNERNFSGIQAEDFNNLDLNYGYSNRDQRWRGIVSGLWDSPWWGLSLSGSYRYTTGSPYTAVAGRDLNNDGNSGTDRPTVDGVHFARNSFRQPDFQSLDLRLSKAIDISQTKLSVFAECFNCANASNRFVTGSSLTWGTADTPLPAFGVENGLGTPRTIQVGARFEF